MQRQSENLLPSATNSSKNSPIVRGQLAKQSSADPMQIAPNQQGRWGNAEALEQLVEEENADRRVV
jgi:hypothetical protein